MNQTEHNDSGEIEYQDGQGMMTTRVTEIKTSQMVNWVMKLSGGLVKSTEQANYILIGVAVVLIAIALSIYQPNSSVGPTNGAVPVGQVVPGSN